MTMLIAERGIADPASAGIVPINSWWRKSAQGQLAVYHRST
jgi:hypothetical protein